MRGQFVVVGPHALDVDGCLHGDQGLLGDGRGPGQGLEPAVVLGAGRLAAGPLDGGVLAGELDGQRVLRRLGGGDLPGVGRVRGVGGVGRVVASGHARGRQDQGGEGRVLRHGRVPSGGYCEWMKISIRRAAAHVKRHSRSVYTCPPCRSPLLMGRDVHTGCHEQATRPSARRRSAPGGGPTRFLLRRPRSATASRSRPATRRECRLQECQQKVGRVASVRTPRAPGPGHHAVLPLPPADPRAGVVRGRGGCARMGWVGSKGLVGKGKREGG